MVICQFADEFKNLQFEAIEGRALFATRNWHCFEERFIDPFELGPCASARSVYNALLWLGRGSGSAKTQRKRGLQNTDSPVRVVFFLVLQTQPPTTQHDHKYPQIYQQSEGEAISKMSGATKGEDRTRLDGFELEVFKLVREHATSAQWREWLRAPLCRACRSQRT